MSDKSSGNGLGLGSVLTIVFVVLKLCGIINWSWWIVLSPMIAMSIIGLGYLIFILWLFRKPKNKVQKGSKK